MKLFWGKNTRAFRIAWLLEEVGTPYDRITIDIRNPESKSDPAFRAVSPMGKVPALEDGPARLWDSGAICIYVGDRFPEAKLAPPIGDRDRARYLQWVTFTNSVIEPAIGERVAKIAPNPSSYGWGSFDAMLDVLRAGLTEARPWILGDRFSAADVMTGTSCHFLRRFGIVGEDKLIDAYVERCAARPAWKRAQAFDQG